MNTPIGASSSAIDVTERCIAKITNLRQTAAANGGLVDAERLDFLLESLKKNQQINREANQRISSTLGNLKKFISLDGGQREMVDHSRGSGQRPESADRRDRRPDHHRSPVWRSRTDRMLPRRNEPGVHEPADQRGRGDRRSRDHHRHHHAPATGNSGWPSADTGAGMTPEVQNQLFNPAFSTKGARVKAGMGLMVSLNIVQKHGGRIEVDSTIGQGSTFTVVGPCSGGN